jgi:hypothetical protein
MKKIFYTLFMIVLLAGCKNKLDEIGFTDNPYDSDYNGEAVVRIDSVSSALVSTTPIIYLTKVHITSLIQMYSNVILYRNGSVLRTVPRSGYESTLIETIDDNTAVSGITYSYTASLKFDSGITQPSNAVSFTTQ